ncbi:MAG: hypothetical protein HFI40_13340 [Lachnospiraceae bacterium]|jgi:hypothetical protein|nr:hypothetical protein [Lachnospiraceae bacterium]
MKTKGVLAILFLSVFLMAGCEKDPVAPENLLAEEIQVETLYLRADGTVQSAYVEEFGKSYYKESELRSFMDEMIAAYNESNGTDIKLTQLRATGGKVYAILTYQDIAAYSTFNADFGKDTASMLAESVSADTAKERYGSLSFYDVKKKAEKNGSEILSDKNQGIAVIQGPIEVQTSGNVLYYSEGSLTDSHTLTVPEGTEAVIVYKKES